MINVCDELAIGQTDTGAPRRGHEALERVCSYARQVCTRVDGCSLPASLLASWDAKAIELRAYECDEAGEALSTHEALYRMKREDHPRRPPREAMRQRRINALRGE